MAFHLWLVLLVSFSAQTLSDQLFYNPMATNNNNNWDFTPSPQIEFDASGQQPNGTIICHDGGFLASSAWCLGLKGTTTVVSLKPTILNTIGYDNLTMKFDLGISLLSPGDYCSIYRNSQLIQTLTYKTDLLTQDTIYRNIRIALGASAANKASLTIGFSGNSVNIDGTCAIDSVYIFADPCSGNCVDTTGAPTTITPTTSTPTTATPTTAQPTTTSPTTSNPTTHFPTTFSPTTAAPTTFSPTISPTTGVPTSSVPTSNEHGISEVATTNHEESLEIINNDSSFFDNIEYIIAVTVGGLMLIICALMCFIFYRKSGNKRLNSNKENMEMARMTSLSDVKPETNVVTDVQSEMGEDDKKGKDYDALKKWLSDIELMEYFDLFIEQGFGNKISMLYELNDNDLKELGIKKMADRKMILKQIDKLKSNAGKVEVDEGDQSEESDLYTQKPLMTPRDDANDINISVSPKDDYSTRNDDSDHMYAKPESVTTKM